MIYLNKILPILLSPLVVVMLLLVYGLLAKRRWPIVLSLIALWAASTPMIANSLFRWVEDHAIRPDAGELPSVDAIVVLGGLLNYVDTEAGRESPRRPGVTPEWGESADRFFAGIELWRKGKAAQLIFTGSLLPWQREVEPEGRYLAREAVALGVDPARITVTSNVTNTEQEARVIAAMLQGDNQQPPAVILVTSAFHMPRAAMLFEQAGVRVVRYPVDFRISSGGREPRHYFPDPRALERTDIAIREVIGRAFYRVKYWF